MTGTRRGALAVPLLALLAGCHDPITEVLLVVTSDLAIPTDVDFASISAVPGSSAGVGDVRGPMFGVPVGQFPISMGVQASQTEVFSARVQLFLSANPIAVVVSRNVTAVRFVHGEVRMLVVPMKRACACQGTSCPLPGTNPDCDDLESPQTVPLDPKIAPPPGQTPPGGVVFDAETGAPFAR
jgi:hypothetical protein